jgi:hypothetical protein
MRILFKTVCFTVVMLFSFAGWAQHKAKEGFSLVKSEPDIFIYERWTIFPKSNPPVKAREVKGEFKIKSTVAKAAALLRDEKMIKEWQKHVSEFKVYLKSDSTWWEEYSYHDIPWPVSDQDHFLIYQLQKGSTPDRMFITFESRVNNTLAPVRDDVTRMVLSGSWLIEKTGPGKIKVTYSILSMPSHIPRIFTDPVIRNNMMSTIKNYIRILETKK